MTAVDEGVELELFVDLEKTIPCEARIPCDQEAKWKITDLPCGHGAVLCEEHKVYENQWFDEVFAAKKRIFCRVCKTPVSSIRWTEL